MCLLAQYAFQEVALFGKSLHELNELQASSHALDLLNFGRTLLECTQNSDWNPYLLILAEQGGLP